MSHLSVKSWSHPCAPASSASGGLCKPRAASDRQFFSLASLFPPWACFLVFSSPCCYSSLIYFSLPGHLACPHTLQICCYMFLQESYGARNKIHPSQICKPTDFLWFPFPDLLGLNPWSWGQFCGHHPGVAGAPLFRVPKEHLTAQLGLLQHCWPEGFGLCFLLNSLYFVKEMSQSHFLTTPDFSSSVGALCVFAPLWGGQQWNLWALSTPRAALDADGSAILSWAAGGKKLLVPDVFQQVLCLRPRWISDVQDGAPDSRYSSQNSEPQSISAAQKLYHCYFFMDSCHLCCESLHYF